MVDIKQLIKKTNSQLGAPALDVELTDEQMHDLFIASRDAYILLDSYSNSKTHTETFMDYWTMQYFVALCKEALGRIRGKFSGELPIPGGEVKFDYKTLLEEAEREKRFLRYLILKDENILTEHYKPVIVFYIGVGSLSSEHAHEYINQIREKLGTDDGFIKYFVTTSERDSKIECIYPSGIDNKTKDSISRMETMLKEIKAEK